MPKADKRRQIMNAAEGFFTSRRLHEITLDEIAREAKVGKGTIYSHFRDKEDLFLQTVMSGFEELCALLRRNVPDDAPFDRQLLSACKEISGFFARRRQLFRMMQTEEERMALCKGSMHERWMEMRRELVRALADIIAKGIAERQLRDDVPSEVLATFLLGMLRTRARDLCGVSEEMRGHELLVDIFCRGACRR